VRDLSIRLEDCSVLASREYRLHDSFPERKVIVRIGLPKPRLQDAQYECPVEIDDGVQIKVRPMIGADAFEALQMALVLVGTDLKSMAEQMGELVWGNGQRRDIGFPVEPDYSLKSVIWPEAS
jgi:hypothetical protein